MAGKQNQIQKQEQEQEQEQEQKQKVKSGGKNNSDLQPWTISGMAGQTGYKTQPPSLWEYLEPIETVPLPLSLPSQIRRDDERML
jgi:hypothetical protein